MNKKNIKKGFTLVELLAVIVILAIILVIAVPKVMSIIEDAKMGTLESTAKMIASGAEKQKVQNTVLGNNKEITCDSVAKINKGDYANCSIEFVDNTAKVTIEGDGKFDGLWVCEGTKTSAEAQKEGCSPEVVLNINQVKSIKMGEQLTLEHFYVGTTYSDGSTGRLWSGGMKPDDSQSLTISSPNWPDAHPCSMTEEENYWEYTFEEADAIQITFDINSKIDEESHTYIAIYDQNNNQVYKLARQEMAGKTYIISGKYIRVTMKSDVAVADRGFSATIKPMYKHDAEYVISPNVAPNVSGDFEVTIQMLGENISQKINAYVSPMPEYGNASKFIKNSFIYKMELKNNLEHYNIMLNEINYDAGIRYVGSEDEVHNKVYYNCDDTDSAGVSYGSNNYDYASSCEVWSIIGVFDVKNENGNMEERVKLINTASTFSASWDSCWGGEDDFFMPFGYNMGYGINQWGLSGDYEGADLMQLLNGYYIGKEGATCTYCNGRNQSTCSQACTEESLKEKNMKVLTNTAKEMIENAIWNINSVDDYSMDFIDAIYGQENGIIPSMPYSKYGYNGYVDDVIRTTSWAGLVGLMSISDAKLSEGWINYLNEDELDIWTLIPKSGGFNSRDYVWKIDSSSINADSAAFSNKVLPSVYLKSNVKIVSGNGDTEPYILAM